jgi:hypothetical protein
MPLYCLFPCRSISVSYKDRRMHAYITHTVLLALCYSDVFQPSTGRLQFDRYFLRSKVNKICSRRKIQFSDQRELHNAAATWLRVVLLLQYICNLHMWPQAAGFTPMAQNLIRPTTRDPYCRSAPLLLPLIPKFCNVARSSTFSTQIWRSSFLIFFMWVLMVIGFVVLRLSCATLRPVRSLTITTYPHRSICKYTSLPMMEGHRMITC